MFIFLAAAATGMIPTRIVSLAGATPNSLTKQLSLSLQSIQQ
jgi:hypothetical protein